MIYLFKDLIIYIKKDLHLFYLSDTLRTYTAKKQVTSIKREYLATKTIFILHEDYAPLVPTPADTISLT